MATMDPAATGSQPSESALRLGLMRVHELWSKLWLGIDGKVLAQLMDGLRFADGQGQLWPLRVLLLDARLRRPLRAAGCTVVVDESPPETWPDTWPLGAELGADAEAQSGAAVRPADLADALVAPAATADPLPLLLTYARRVRRGGLLVLCSRPGFPARPRLAAALLHAGLTEVVQIPAGRVILSAGRVTHLPRAG